MEVSKGGRVVPQVVGGYASRQTRRLALAALAGVLCLPGLGSSPANAQQAARQAIDSAIQSVLQNIRDQIQRRQLVAPAVRPLRFSGEDEQLQQSVVADAFG